MIFPLILFLLNHATYSSKVLRRHCNLSAKSPVSDSKSLLFFALFLGFLFCLLFLGFLKALIGLLWYPRIGMYGLDLLVDLPQFLPHYYETELRDQPVVYDDGGWPIHPSTRERTVRVISKRTEFYLNLVFFLSYPLAGAVYLCSLCCGINTVNSDQSCLCYKHGKIVQIDGVREKGSRILGRLCKSKSKTVSEDQRNLQTSASFSSTSISSSMDDN